MEWSYSKKRLMAPCYTYRASTVRILCRHWVPQSSQGKLQKELFCHRRSEGLHVRLRGLTQGSGTCGDSHHRSCPCFPNCRTPSCLAPKSHVTGKRRTHHSPADSAPSGAQAHTGSKGSMSALEALYGTTCNTCPDSTVVVIPHTWY